MKEKKSRGRVNPVEKYNLEKEVIQMHVDKNCGSKEIKKYLQKEYTIEIAYSSIDSFLKNNKKAIEAYIKANPKAGHELAEFTINTAKELHMVLNESKGHLIKLTKMLSEKKINYKEFLKLSNPLRQDYRKAVELALKAQMKLPDMSVFIDNRSVNLTADVSGIAEKYTQMQLKKIGDVLIHKKEG